MAILWADGFDHWGSAGNALTGGYQSFTSDLFGPGAGARTGNYYVRGQGGNANPVRRALAAPMTKGGVCFGLTTNAAGSGGTACFQTNTSFNANDANAALGINMNANLSISIMRGTTVVGTTAPNAYVLNTWDQYELKFDATGAAGTHTAELRKNGNPTALLIVTGLTIPTVNYVGLFGGNNFYDDFVVWDSSTAFNNDWLGDRKCVTLFATANGALQQWTPNTGTAWSNIAAVPPGANYIASSTTGDVSEFAHSALPILTASIAGISIYASVLKTDAGLAAYRIGMNKAGVVQNSPAINPGTTYSFGNYIMQTDPDGLAWTRTTLDAAAIRITRDT